MFFCVLSLIFRVSSKSVEIWGHMTKTASRSDCYHALHGSASPVFNGDWSSQWETAKFDFHKIHSPWPITKNVMGRRPLGLCQILCKSVHGAADKIFIYLFTDKRSDPSTGQTRRQIFACGGSNDEDLCKDVPFGGFVDIAPHLWGKSPKHPISGAWIGVLSQKRKILTVSYYQNFSIDSNQIFLREHGPNTRPTNNCDENNVKSPYLCNRLTDFDFVTMSYWPHTTDWPLKCCIFENPIIVKNTKIVISQQRFDRSLQNLVWRCKMGLLTAPTVKNFNFKNRRWRTAAIFKNR